MNLTVSVSSVEQARQAIDLLQAYLRLNAAPAVVPASPPSETPVGKLGLSTRATNCLLSEGIKTVEELVCYTAGELRRLPNFGRITVDEIAASMEARGQKLGQKYHRIPRHSLKERNL